MSFVAGVDVSKDALQVAICSSSGEWLLQGQSVPNNAEGFQQLRQLLPDASQSTLSFEASGGYEKPLRDWALEHTDYAVVCLNPYQVKCFAESQGKRAKTDPVDARTIATFTAVADPDSTHIHRAAREELRELTRHLEHLKKQRQQEQSYAESVQDPRRQQHAQQSIDHYNEQIEQVQQEIDELLEEHPDLKNDVDLLTSIPGISDSTAWVLLAELQEADRPQQLDPKQETAHAGLDPRIEQSGSSLDRSSLSKRGSPRLRKRLYFPALAAIRHNPLIKDFYERLIGRGKQKMVAVCACMRKLLCIAVGVLKNQAEFDPNWQQNHA